MKPIEDRFFAKVEFSPDRYDGTPCLLWTASLDGHGYGAFYDGTRTEAGNPKTVRAHRWLYERWLGPVPDGLDLDHLCRVRHCVNPDHLEPVTRAVNLARSSLTPQARRAAQTHCLRGHEFTPENTYLRAHGRSCRQCALDQAAARYAATISSRESNHQRKASHP